jgi:4-diphosphocytidyl-2-C-methyl-D-erythritol kinase
VGSDVPLFLLGGAVVGSDRGQLVTAAPDITLAGSAEIACVLALPPKGVSTPLAFRDWDRLLAVGGSFVTDLHNQPIRDKVEVLSRTYASVLMGLAPESSSPFGKTGISSNSSSEPMITTGRKQEHPENQQGLSREQRHNSPEFFAETHGESRIESDLAENSLLALVRTGIENDFETVVFPLYPLLRDLKRHLKGNSASGDTAVYTALSGSGSVLFGLYRSQADAMDAQRRLHVSGVEALVTTTMPRTRYWSEMFAE